jgi:hypothetical protein
MSIPIATTITILDRVRATTITILDTLSRSHIHQMKVLELSFMVLSHRRNCSLVSM